MINKLLVGIVFVIASSCIVVPKPVTAPIKKSVYKEVDLEEMIRRYIAKTHQQSSSIEGIYTVSGVVTKRGKSFLNPSGKEKIVVRKDNYARVAILRDWPGSNTEYVEISLNEKNAPRYPIVAELNSLSEGGGFTYKHIEPKGETMTFTFLYDQNKSDILEGVYTKTKNNVEVTYKLTYVKVYPKNNNFESD
jgi:hypothetical protein